MLRLKIRQVIEGFFELGPTKDTVEMQILIKLSSTITLVNLAWIAGFARCRLVELEGSKIHTIVGHYLVCVGRDDDIVITRGNIRRVMLNKHGVREYILTDHENHTSFCALSLCRRRVLSYKEYHQ